MSDVKRLGSRSTRHFCELYETYFKDGIKALVAIRESIRLDWLLGRALVGILLVCAHMEREATGERTRVAINHIKKSGYHFGKVPYGKRKIPASDNPRMKILIEDEAELAVLAQIKTWAAEGIRITEIASRLNATGTKPPQGATWTKSLLYNLRLRLSHIIPKPHNERPYGDNEVKERILELRANGHSLRQIAAILNEQGWLPLKARRFTVENIHGLLARTSAAKLLSPRRYLQMMLTKMERANEKESPGEPFEKPPLPTLLEEAEYKTPRGHEHWWPSQVAQVLEGRFEGYYGTQSGEAGGVR